MSHSELDLQDTMDAMMANAAIMDETGKILCVNTSWKEFGRNNQGVSHSINEGSNYTQVVEIAAREGDSYAKAFQDSLKRILNRDIDSFELEYPCNSQTEERWFIANIREVGNSTPRHFLVTHKNITELVKRERQVMAGLHLEEIGRYTSGIAHDFNNLLGIMSSSLELIKLNGVLDAKTEKYINDCTYAVDRGQALIRQLLAYARQQVLAPATVGIDDLLGDIIKSSRAAINENIELNFDPGARNQLVSVDPDMLSSAILNLMINAQFAMPEGGSIRVKTDMTELAGETLLSSDDPVTGAYVSITVQDTGCGIEEENIERVFEPFFSTRKAGTGSGLGLSMIMGFMKQSKGHISIASKPQKGTAITLYLPL